MSRLQRVNNRWAAAVELAGAGIELLTVADDQGSALNSAIKSIALLQRDDERDLWSDILSAARQLRWRVVTEPLPAALAPERTAIIDALISHASAQRRLVGELGDAALEALGAAAAGMTEAYPPVGAALLSAVDEIGDEPAVVVTASFRAESVVTSWFAEWGIRTPVIRATVRDGFDVVDQAYAIGPPRLFPASLVSAPRARALTCVFPHWEANHALPVSPLAYLVEHPLRPRTRTFLQGTPDPGRPAELRADDSADDLRPVAMWASTSRTCQSPGEDEVMARKVLLSGGLATYLDSAGDHIRTLDPNQPERERVAFTDVSAVSVGTYLVLREGETESVVLYSRALDLLGELGPDVRSSQRIWKDALQERLARLGRSAVSSALGGAGVRRHTRAVAWTNITVVRPQDSDDFIALLQWLDIPLQPALEYANRLRRCRSQASADVREALEDALSAASLGDLESNGHLRMDLELPGFSGIIASRVLAISPHVEPASRYDIRIPRQDRSARWLE